jgi:hypothetical protein
MKNHRDKGRAVHARAEFDCSSHFVQQPPSAARLVALSELCPTWGKLYRNSHFGKHFGAKNLRFSGLSAGFKSLLLHQIRSQVRNGGCSMGSNRGATSRLTPRRFERSACPGNESRNARFHNRIEPDSRSDFLSDLFDGVIGNSRDIKILLDVIAVRSRGQKRRPSLDRPG